MCVIFEFWWNNFFMGMKFNFEIWENFYKGFPCKKKITWEFFVKWTKIRIQWDSFVNFSVGGSRSIYRGIPYKIEDEKFYKGFPCNIGLICLHHFFMGMKFDFKFEIWESFSKDFYVNDWVTDWVRKKVPLILLKIGSEEVNNI